MPDVLSRLWDNLVARPDGPLALRFYLQPLMSMSFAVMDGLRDVEERHPPFLWTMATERRQRSALLRDMWHSIGKIFMLAVILDVGYQLTEFQRVRPLETLIVAFVLAVVPYALVRGPVARLVRGRRRIRSRHM